MDDREEGPRFELTGMTPRMRRGMLTLSRRAGLSQSAWIRSLVAAELARAFGDDWLDHPEGDQGNGE